MFLGAAGGTALVHLPGLEALSGAAIGIGAMTLGMLRLPMTSVLLVTLFLGSTGLTVIRLVIVGVVVSYVITLRLPDPGPHVSASAPAPAPEPSPTTMGLTS